MCQTNTGVLFGEAAALYPSNECKIPVAPSDFDRLISGCRLAQTVLLGDHSWLKKTTVPVPVAVTATVILAVMTTVALTVTVGVAGTLVGTKAIKVTVAVGDFDNGNGKKNGNGELYK